MSRSTINFRFPLSAFRFALVITVSFVSCSSAFAQLTNVINKGRLQGPLDANYQDIIRVRSITDTNGNPIAGSGGTTFIYTNAGPTLVTNLSGTVSVNTNAPGSGTVGLVSSNDNTILITPEVITTGITNFKAAVNPSTIATAASLTTVSNQVLYIAPAELIRGTNTTRYP